MIKFYSIYKKDDRECLSLLRETAESAKKYNISIIPSPGVYSGIKELIKKKKLFINKLGQGKIRTDGVLGCFLSHYQLWEQCLEFNEPLGILEYDALFINSIPDNILDQFDDHLHLDYVRNNYLSQGFSTYHEKVIEDKNFEIKKLEFVNSSRHPFKIINRNHLRGAYGYIIKPQGAEKLIKATQEYGILPTDLQINLTYCNMHYTIPSIVMLNPNSIKKASHTNNDFTKN